MRIARLFISSSLLLGFCGAAHAQLIEEWRDLLTKTDNTHATVYFRKSDCEVLHGEFRIKRGPDEECVRFSHGLMEGEYRRYRDGVLRESGVYADGLRNGFFSQLNNHKSFYPVMMQTTVI